MSLDRVCCCPIQLGDEFWPKKGKQSTAEPSSELEPDPKPLSTSVWVGWLRNRLGTP